MANELIEFRTKHGIPVDANFSHVDKTCLEMSLKRCGLASYPAVSGDPSGDRCSGEMVCTTCGMNYYQHPEDWRLLGYGDRPFLNIICDGQRVKL